MKQLNSSISNLRCGPEKSCREGGLFVHVYSGTKRYALRLTHHSAQNAEELAASGVVIIGPGTVMNKFAHCMRLSDANKLTDFSVCNLDEADHFWKAGRHKAFRESYRRLQSPFPWVRFDRLSQRTIQM
jgi:hypothetical protein